VKLPIKGRPRDDILAAIEEMQRADVKWRDGHAWAYVYFADDDLLTLTKDAYLSSFSENALAPSAFPSLRQMEEDVVAMAADLFSCPASAGSITSGGSESIFLAVKTARDWAQSHRPQIDTPEMVLPITAHPAFDKAAHYLGVKSVRVAVDGGFRADPKAMADQVSEDTILVVGSAPSYPHGMIDPLPELSALALERGLLLHVDACLGGFLLPFIRQLGRPINDFDFALKGVTSMSADLHKYGYAAKGASVILHRSKELYSFQGFTFDNWPGARYSAPNLTGTRPGGSVAAAWATLNYLGVAGYLELTKRSLGAADALIEGIGNIPSLAILGAPQATVFAFTSQDRDLAAIGGAMRKRGWAISLQDKPASLHLTVTASHDRVVDQFLADLRLSTEGTEDDGAVRLEAGYA
jgi:sphinganine-1-phosphate aldolase